MKSHHYSCSYCQYALETSGPWPYTGEGSGKKPFKDLFKTYTGPIHGLIASVYCPQCDKKKEYDIVQYERPLTNPDEIWLTSHPRKTKMVCRKCRGPVYIIFPSGKVKCPRCKRGVFEVSYPFEEMEKASFPVPPPDLPLRVRQGGVGIRIPKPFVIIDSQEHRGYTFERFKNWFSGT